MKASLKNITDICNKYLTTILVFPFCRFPHLDHVSIYSGYVIFFFFHSAAAATACASCVLHLGQPRHFFLYVCLYVYPQIIIYSSALSRIKRIILDLFDVVLTAMVSNWRRGYPSVRYKTFSRGVGFGGVSLATWLEVPCITTMHVLCTYSLFKWILHLPLCALLDPSRKLTVQDCKCHQNQQRMPLTETSFAAAIDMSCIFCYVANFSFGSDCGSKYQLYVSLTPYIRKMERS